MRNTTTVPQGIIKNIIRTEGYLNLSERALFERFNGSDRILIADDSRNPLTTTFGVLWTSLLYWAMLWGILVIAIVFVAKLIGVSHDALQGLGAICIFASVAAAIWSSIKDQQGTEHVSWTIERYIDLPTRGLVLTANGYNYKTRKQLDLRETFPLDQLELQVASYDLSDGADYYHYLIFLQPTKAGRTLAKNKKFKIRSELYRSKSGHSGDNPVLDEDVKRVVMMLAERLKIPVVPKDLRAQLRS